MKTLEQIKDEYSKSVGYLSWIALKKTCPHYDEEKHENELLILVQKECLKNASESCHPFQQVINNEENIIR